MVVESMTEMAEAALAVKAAKKTGLLVVGSMTFDSGPNKTDTAMGVTPQQAVEGLIHAGADIVGCNCGIGIDDCVRVVEMMRAATDKPIWVKANAGMPEIGGGNIVYEMTPTEFADKAKMLVRAGANIIGGCCGTSPEFIRALRATRLR